MEYLCPLCNGMEKVTVKCENCGETMRDMGTIQDFFDDYSPYLDTEITRKVDGVNSDQCLHLFNCPNCNADKRVVINLVEY